MIIKFDHTNNKNAQIIKDLFFDSYTIEAKILGIINFPPLKRTVPQFVNSSSCFYAYHTHQKISGLIEIK